MTKKVLDKQNIKKIVDTTQHIEGYSEASKKVKDEAKIVRKKYGIKVSAKR
ncbi:hypothetical protein [Halarcobacter ebronensis]|uniref:hypothetical protein n=1 Tax=Halarcobacter ebronensis TaxID=1462615 RepID=UPI0013E9606F|nr:hypothetical protein [Halarcobacter ebronensis]QKF81751.1 hypothetical protein AEBR_1257 [Halarcobacter ebronensis]